MDPTTLLAELLSACMCNDPGTAKVAAYDLGDWLQRGGFLPEVRGAIMDAVPGLVEA